MKRSRLIELLSSLNNEDIKNLKFYIESKLHNTNKKIVILYEIISGYPEGRSINEIILYELLCSRQKISQANFRMLISDFSDLIETYLAYNKLQNDEIIKLEYLLQYAFERDLPFLLNKTMAKLESYFEKRNDLSIKEKSVKVQYLIISSSVDNRHGNEVNSAAASLMSELRLQLAGMFRKSNVLLPDNFLNELQAHIKNLKRNDLCTYFYFLLLKIKSGENINASEFESIYENTNSTPLKLLAAEKIINDENIPIDKKLEYARLMWQHGGERIRIKNIDGLLLIAVRNYEMELSKKIVKFLLNGQYVSKGYFSLALYYFYFNEFTSCLNELDKLKPSDTDENAQIRQLKMCCYVRMNHTKKFINAYQAYRKFALANKETEIIKDTTKFCNILFLIINNKHTLDKLISIENILISEDVINKDWLKTELNFHFKKLA